MPIINLFSSFTFIISNTLFVELGIIGFNKSEILMVLEKCREFDPVGVFARDLADCFSLQLADRDRLDPVMQVFLKNLDLMLRYDISALQSVCMVDRNDIIDIIAELKLLNPKPGLVFQQEITEWAIPDIIVYPNKKGGWFISMVTSWFNN